MPKVNLPSHVALTALAFAGAAHAEGIALGNPLTGASFGWLFGLPLLGSAALLLAMALIKGLRKALLVALLLCACFAGILALVGMSGMSMRNRRCLASWARALTLDLLCDHRNLFLRGHMARKSRDLSS